MRENLMANPFIAGDVSVVPENMKINATKIILGVIFFSHSR